MPLPCRTAVSEAPPARARPRYARAAPRRPCWLDRRRYCGRQPEGGRSYRAQACTFVGPAGGSGSRRASERVDGLRRPAGVRWALLPIAPYFTSASRRGQTAAGLCEASPPAEHRGGDCASVQAVPGRDQVAASAEGHAPGVTASATLRSGATVYPREIRITLVPVSTARRHGPVSSASSEPIRLGSTRVRGAVAGAAGTAVTLPAGEDRS